VIIATAAMVLGLLSVLTAPVKLLLGVIMTSKNTHCPTGTGCVEK
jgi:hypothetical protein